MRPGSRKRGDAPFRKGVTPQPHPPRRRHDKQFRVSLTLPHRTYLSDGPESRAELTICHRNSRKYLPRSATRTRAVPEESYYADW